MKRWRGAALAGCFATMSLGSCIAPSRPAMKVSAPAPAPSPAEPAPLGAFALSGALAQGGLVRGVAPAGTLALTLDGRPVRIAPGGRFLIGFGRDAAPTAALIATMADGRIVAQPLAVVPRQWDVQSLATLPKGTAPTPDFLARRPIEIARINAARRVDADSAGWTQQLMWPAIGRISGRFGSVRIYAGEPGDPHSGVDVAVGTGTPVRAPADGVVVLAAESPFTLEGNLLIIDHGMGLNSAFLHLSRIDVREGDRVSRGEIVAASGMTGRATGPHLHWAMKLGDTRIDPELAAGPMGR